MKKSISFRFASLFASAVITAVLFEAVAQLGHAAPDGQIQVAQVNASVTLR